MRAGSTATPSISTACSAPARPSATAAASCSSGCGCSPRSASITATTVRSTAPSPRASSASDTLSERTGAQERDMYIEHFRLTGQPFQLTPDARFWFASRTHRKAMAYLGYGLAQGEGFIVVTGEIGAGKSTLVSHLLASIDRQRLNAISLVSTQVEGDDMLRHAALGLGVEIAGVEKARLLDLVERRVDEEIKAGKRNLLIVDEAQNLPVSALEELRMLSNFQVGGRPLIQIFLLGQPEFADKLA